MTYDGLQDFLREIDTVPELPRGEQGEWCDAVNSRWIDGVFYRERLDPYLAVGLSRIANNQPAYDPEISYEVRLNFTNDQLTMTPEAAINLGRHLLELGTFSMRDLGRNAWFLANEGQAPQPD